MEIVFDDKLYNKVLKYCIVAANQFIKKEGRHTLNLAEEACQIVMEDLWKKKDGYFKDRKLTDNLLFITCKNKTHDHINKQYNTRKRELWLDKNSINIDAPSNGDSLDYTIELIDEDTEDGVQEQKQEYEALQEELLQKINDALSSNDSKDIEKQIFLDFYLYRLTQDSIVKKRGCSKNYVTTSLKKMRNVLKYEFNLDQGKIQVLRNFKNKKEYIR